MKDKTFICSCGSEFLRITKDEDGFWIVSFYSLVEINNSKHRIWDYFKRVVKTILCKEISIAEIMLDTEQRKELKKFISEV